GAVSDSIQARLAAHSAAPPFGWKIAATSREGQAHIGVDGPLAGRLLVREIDEALTKLADWMRNQADNPHDSGHARP
ncbi:MAG: hypothetical protein B7Y95_23925, partial [Rhizobiales bacterium 32-66-11]